MSLDQLPSELQIEIFRYLPNTDLKAARAVSRRLRDNASPMLFHSVVACARYMALGAFQKISTHAVLASYVKEVVFDGSLYEELFANSQDAYCAKNDDMAELRISAFWGKRTRWKRYQELYKDQEDMKESGVLLQTISRSLEWTTNLSSLVYSPHPHLIPTEKKEVRDLLPRGLNSRSFQADRLWGSRSRSAGHPFRHVVGAIYVSQFTGIRELRVERFKQDRPGTEFTLAIFDFQDAADLEAATYLFQRLEKCTLNMAGIWAPSMAANKSLANLRVLLAAAIELRHLDLHLTRWSSTSPSMHAFITHDDETMFLHFGLQNTWSKLRSLSLEGIEGGQKEFLALIRRHKYSLACLALRNCCLVSGTWSEVVDEVVYNTRILPFSLNHVRELDPPWVDDEDEHMSDTAEEWRYEGHVVLSKDGERSFVDTNPERKSVYHWRQPRTEFT